MLTSSCIARTPLHFWHVSQGAHLAEHDGWTFPAYYTDVEQELAAARTGLALADISATAKACLRGPGVARMTPTWPEIAAAARPLGSSRLGGNNSILACRLTQDHLLLLASGPQMVFQDAALTLAVSLAGATGNMPDQVVLVNQTCHYAGFCLAGPRAGEVLRHLTALDVAEGECAQTSLAGVPALLVRCTAFTIPTLRLYVPWDLGEFVWQRLLEEGRSAGIVPLGWHGWQLFHRHRQPDDQ